MPPAALALAILLHVLIGAAIWWLAPMQPAEPEDPPIMVMFDSTPSNVGLQAPEKAGPAAESPGREPAEFDRTAAPGATAAGPRAAASIDDAGAAKTSPAVRSKA